MQNQFYSLLQIREVFHIEFLRIFSRKVKAANYALKGGVNLRLFLKSIRYSEDMDLDVQNIQVLTLKNTVMNILESKSFINFLKPFGIENVIPPDISKAKQTETTQRFKIHLITSNGEDLFTKIEFSRREKYQASSVAPVDVSVLRLYKLSPLIVSHYSAESAVAQKICALANRSVVQARDIFDLYVLSSQVDIKKFDKNTVDVETAKKACDNIFSVSFEQFRDTVTGYLSEEDRKIYSVVLLWDEIKLRIAKFIEEDICHNFRS